jgi:hypothetical protein
VDNWRRDLIELAKTFRDCTMNGFMYGDGDVRGRLRNENRFGGVGCAKPPSAPQACQTRYCRTSSRCYLHSKSAPMSSYLDKLIPDGSGLFQVIAQSSNAQPESGGAWRVDLFGVEWSQRLTMKRTSRMTRIVASFRCHIGFSRY